MTQYQVYSLYPTGKIDPPPDQLPQYRFAFLMWSRILPRKHSVKRENIYYLFIVLTDNEIVWDAADLLEAMTDYPSVFSGSTFVWVRTAELAYALHKNGEKMKLSKVAQQWAKENNIDLTW